MFFSPGTFFPLPFRNKKKKKKPLDSRSWFSGTAVETFPPLQGTYIGFYVMEFCLPSRACLHYTILLLNCQTHKRKKRKITFFCELFSLCVNLFVTKRAFFDFIAFFRLNSAFIRLSLPPPYPRFPLIFPARAIPRRPRPRCYPRAE